MANIASNIRLSTVMVQEASLGRRGVAVTASRCLHTILGEKALGRHRPVNLLHLLLLLVLMRLLLLVVLDEGG